MGASLSSRAMVVPRALCLVLGVSACSSSAEERPIAEKSSTAAVSATSAPRPTARPRPTTGIEGQFTKFMQDNDALAAEIVKASSAGFDDAKRVFLARRDDLKKQFDAIKNLPSNAVTEQTVGAFTENVAHAINEICSLGIGSSKESDRYKRLCEEYTKLVEAE